MVCSGPLMSRKQYGEFLDRYEWVPLSLSSDQNPLLTAGFLRNNGIVARMQKGIPVSMFFPVAAKVFVAQEHAASAQEMLSDLKKNIRTCPGCGHLLMPEEEECSYCVDERRTPV